ncbi:hypothetical protein ABE438_11380 [Bosea sp. TWI1241]|uniref:hypothetical protein n=1 Tax=Bosea sp. TWI1241 TaxID=3148904 RepID=UPI00320B99AB
MADYLVTYDFKVGASSQYKEFVECAEAEGLLYFFHGTEQLHRLTNTTLWGVFVSTEEAKKAFDRAKAAAEGKVGRKIVLEKRVITLLSGWSILSDTKKAPETKWTKSTKFETCRAHQKNDPFFAY